MRFNSSRLWLVAIASFGLAFASVASADNHTDSDKAATERERDDGTRGGRASIPDGCVYGFKGELVKQPAGVLCPETGPKRARRQ